VTGVKVFLSASADQVFPDRIERATAAVSKASKAAVDSMVSSQRRPVQDHKNR